MLEDWRVWRPADDHALLRALAGDGALANTVLWLNESRRFLKRRTGQRVAAALTDLLNTPSRGPVLIVGTLWRDDYVKLNRKSPDSALDEVRKQARSLLNQGTTISVPEHFEKDALVRLRDLSDRDPRLAEAAEQGGRRITQYLAGGRELLERNKMASVEARAVLDAATDAFRLGQVQDLPDDFLRTAAAAYLDPVHWRIQTDEWRDSWFDNAIAETKQPCRGVPGPLAPVIPLPGSPALAETFYQMSDYLLQHLTADRHFEVPPTGFWTAAADHLTRHENLVALAGSADSRWRIRHADQLYHAAAEKGDLESLLSRAWLRRRIGDHAGEQYFEQQALERGHPRLSYEKGMELKDAGDQQGALLLFQRAADGLETSAMHEVSLHRLSIGDREGSLSLIRQMADLGEELAQYILSRIGKTPEEVKRIEREEADSADQLALEFAAIRRRKKENKACIERLSAIPGTRFFLRSLVLLLEREGNYEGAELVAHITAHAGQLAPSFELALYRERGGDGAGADRILERILAKQPWLFMDLALHRERDGDEQGAERAALIAANAGHPAALEDIFRQRSDTGNRAGAERIAVKAANSKHFHLLITLVKQCEQTESMEAGTRLLLRAETAHHLVMQREQLGNKDGAELAARLSADMGDGGILRTLAKYRYQAGGTKSSQWGQILCYGLEADGSTSAPWW